LFADSLGDIGVLKKQCALKILPAVQAGAQNEMAVEKRAGFAKKREEIFVAHFISSVTALCECRII